SGQFAVNGKPPGTLLDAMRLVALLQRGIDDGQGGGCAGAPGREQKRLLRKRKRLEGSSAGRQKQRHSFLSQRAVGVELHRFLVSGPFLPGRSGRVAAKKPRPPIVRPLVGRFTQKLECRLLVQLSAPGDRQRLERFLE